MARNTQDETQAQETAAAPAADAPAASAAGARPRIQFSLDEQAVKDLEAVGVSATVGQVMTRQEYIKHRWQDGKDATIRGNIARELTRLEGKTVPYQIVFQATKKKPEAAPAAEAEAAPASE